MTNLHRNSVNDFKTNLPHEQQVKCHYAFILLRKEIVRVGNEKGVHVISMPVGETVPAYIVRWLKNSAGMQRYDFSVDVQGNEYVVTVRS